MPTRIEKELPTRFPSVVLYLRDIEDIIKIIKEETGQNVIISDDEYRYESLDELIKHRGDTVKHLSIETENTHPILSETPLIMVTFTVSGGHNSLYIYSADQRTKRAIHEKLADIAHERIRTFAQLVWLHEMNGWLISVYSVMFYMFYAASRYATESGHTLTANILSMALLVGVLQVSISILASRGVWSKVYLVNPHEKPKNFFRRNKDKIIVGVISVILGVIIKTGCDAVWPMVQPPKEAIEKPDK